LVSWFRNKKNPVASWRLCALALNSVRIPDDVAPERSLIRFVAAIYKDVSPTGFATNFLSCVRVTICENFVRPRKFPANEWKASEWI
jgi:hypothetical protein